MAFNKKASLNMSINAIVMLVMAMALLGLGLTFIRGMMGGATGKLGGAIDAADLSEPPTAEKPVTMDRTIKIKRGKTVNTKIGFYNTGDAVTDAVPEFDSTAGDACKGSGSGGSFTPGIVALPQDVGSGQSAAYEVIIDLSQANPQPGPGTYACKLAIANTEEEKQFFLEVTS
ncbi:hypothetical protein JXM83_04800 [Candidatus Woesearchaeota archaeon]|nr:hypothetical protein [Candidatus Woesearchaeota archaeon]